MNEMKIKTVDKVEDYLAISETPPAAAVVINELCDTTRDLAEALVGMVKMYTELAESGDCGFWNPSGEPEYDAAIEVLQALDILTDQADRGLYPEKALIENGGNGLNVDMAMLDDFPPLYRELTNAIIETARIRATNEWSESPTGGFPYWIDCLYTHEKEVLIKAGVIQEQPLQQP